MYYILHTAIPCPLRQTFDYWVESDLKPWLPGIRIMVPFGSRSLIGIVCQVSEVSECPDNLKTIEKRLDDEPLLTTELLNLVPWLSQYYHHPIGDCFQTVLPKHLRSEKSAQPVYENYWQFLKDPEKSLTAKQNTLLTILKNADTDVSEYSIKQKVKSAQATLTKLAEQGIIQKSLKAKLFHSVTEKKDLHKWALNSEQSAAYEKVITQNTHFQAFLLQGITGSGKTELYIQLAERIIQKGLQVLVLIPEINLTSQFIERFQKGLTARIGLSHSGISDTQRTQTWLLARAHEIDLVIGTRSAVFTPFKKLGLIIIDEEHETAYKQQDGLRYHARNIGLLRAKNNQIPIVLGSATPSLESLYQVQQQRFELLTLTQRTGTAQLPNVELIDCQSLTNHDHGLSNPLLNAITTHLQAGQQVLIFINRRGFAPVLMCHDCGWQAVCKHCDSKLVVHHQSHRLICHHCGFSQRLTDTCPSCQAAEIQSYGLGTEKIEQTLQSRFPETVILRIDQDTTKRNNAFSDMLEIIQKQQPAILVGTQMLAKGHDFPEVTLVGILDADQGLFSADFRATELLAQSITQVTGRAGRGNKPGTVLIQTRQANHPFWQQLLKKGYQPLAQKLLEERIEFDLPPKQFWAVWRAESKTAGLALTLLTQLMQSLPPHQHVDMMGPVPSIMEKRAGYYRAQILFSSANRNALHRVIDYALQQIKTLKLAQKVRWSIDIDPTELL